MTSDMEYREDDRIIREQPSKLILCVYNGSISDGLPVQNSGNVLIHILHCYSTSKFM